MFPPFFPRGRGHIYSIVLLDSFWIVYVCVCVCVLCVCDNELQDKQDFLNSHQIEDVEQAPEAMRRASEQIPDLLEVWELVAFFAGILKCPASVVGATFWDFCERMCNPKALLFHWYFM